MCEPVGCQVGDPSFAKLGINGGLVSLPLHSEKKEEKKLLILIVSVIFLCKGRKYYCVVVEM